jgi:hypothetical protein
MRSIVSAVGQIFTRVGLQPKSGTLSGSHRAQTSGAELTTALQSLIDLLDLE